MNRVIETDVAVVGAGPIGLELAVALKKEGIDYLHFDAKQIGYTISWFAPQTKFFSSNDRIAIAGVPLQTVDQGKATREEYLAYLRGVVQLFDLKIQTYEPVVRIDRLDNSFHLETKQNGHLRTYRARHVVLCTGGTDHPRLLNVPGENLPHVDHYFRDPHLFFRKRLLIVGGRNSAVESAIRCYRAGADVSISYRRGQLDQSSIKYWLLPEINGLVASGKIQGYFGTTPTEITESDVKLRHIASGDVTTHPFDFVLLLVGYEADMKLLACAGVELRGDCQVPVFTEQTMESNVPGLYVAGCAVGGTQEKYKIFLENCHVHVARIVAALKGKRADIATPEFARPET